MVHKTGDLTFEVVLTQQHRVADGVVVRLDITTTGKPHRTLSGRLSLDEWAGLVMAVLNAQIATPGTGH